MLTIECVDGMSGAPVGSAKFLLHEGGRISVPAVEKRFGASSLALGTPDGVVVDSTADGFSHLTFMDGATAKLFRWKASDHDTSSRLHFPSFWNFLRARGSLGPSGTPNDDHFAKGNKTKDV